MELNRPLSEADLNTLLLETFLGGLSFFDETDSTNTQALALLASDEIPETPHLVFSNVQTTGRGRGSNQWWSSPGSLTFSVIIDTSELGLNLDQLPQLSLLTSMALLQAGMSVVPDGDFALKWPNDVYLGDRKLAGILAEVPAQSAQRSTSAAPRVVIGIGLNVNNQFANAPAEIQSKGVSLSDVSGQIHNRLEVLASFLRHFEHLLQSMARGEAVLEHWHAYCLLNGKQVTIETGSTVTTGCCRGIDTAGALLLETAQGRQRFVGGVVKAWSSSRTTK